jgi:hypothetical protein
MKRKTKAQLAAEKLQADQERVVAWSSQFGAPITILQGWDPDTGLWDALSPVGVMLNAIEQRGAHITVAAQLATVRNVGQLMARGYEYLVEAPEDRMYIPIDVRVFVDLVNEIEHAEAKVEVDLVKTVRSAARSDPKIALAMLSRRFGQRWREQQAIFTADEHDERDAAVSKVLANPDAALALAEIAHQVENEVISSDPDR